MISSKSTYFRVVFTVQFDCNASRKKSSQNDPPILRVKISSRVGHRRKSYERTKRQGGGLSGKLGGIFQIFWNFFNFQKFNIRFQNWSREDDDKRRRRNIENKISGYLARARARARTAPSPGGGRLRHLSTKRFTNVFGGARGNFRF